MTQLLGKALAVNGSIDLSEHDSWATPGFDGDKRQAETELKTFAVELADLQERLFAAGRTDSAPTKILVVLQGMDTSGKGGTLRGVAGLLDPQGLAIASFKTPTPEELEHDFLWRVERALPEPGMIGIFDRSHYEDVLIGRVRQLAPASEIERRYEAINEFERRFQDSGGRVIKCFLHITADDQHERLAARLEDPTKYWNLVFQPQIGCKGHEQLRVILHEAKSSVAAATDQPPNTATARSYTFTAGMVMVDT